MAQVIDPRPFQGGRALVWSLVAAAIGLILFVVGLFWDPDRALFSYLTAWVFATSICVSALILLMIGYAVNGRWFAVIRRLNEAVTAALPVLAILFVPIALGAGRLFPWVAPGPEATEHELHIFHHREAYLNLPFFIVRAVLYFGVWILCAFLLRRWSRRRDRAREAGGDPEALLVRERVFASAMLPAVGLAFTFAAFDWVMGLEPEWHSGMFGIYLFAGGFLGALSLVIVLAHLARASGGLAGVITPNHFHALGRLLLAFVVFWAYAAFFQAMLIAILNRPEEVVFYLRRIEGAWAAFVYLLVLGHFALPFLILIRRSIKFQPRAMAFVGAWLIALHLVDVYWLVMPMHASPVTVVHPLDVAGLLLVTGAAGAFAIWMQRGVPLVAAGDPFLPEGIAYRSHL